jgi:hypothetical protein
LKTGKNSLSRIPPVLQLLALVPHRDARLPLRSWSASLFAAGLPGAWSFPHIIPLASLRRPLSVEELKLLALSLREQVNLCGGKFIAGPPVPAVLPEIKNTGKIVSVFGPSLQIDIPDDFFTPVEEAVVCRISPLVLGSALVTGDTTNYKLQTTNYPPFRAAALANMNFRPLVSGEEWDGCSAEWEIGKLFWLPKK